MSIPRPAAFVAVGSELLRTERVDTNSVLAGRLLAPYGFAFVEKRCVEDNTDAIATAITELLSRAELVLVSGGLGPTADDVTREAAAQALGLALERDPRLETTLVERYQQRGREMPSGWRTFSPAPRCCRTLSAPHRGSCSALATGCWFSCLECRSSSNRSSVNTCCRAGRRSTAF
jgi:molybdenum cofactor synthesis domain-containing protein